MSLTLALLTGCVTRTQQGVNPPANWGSSVLLQPFVNATPDENAARALSEITAAALMQRGIHVVTPGAGGTNLVETATAGAVVDQSRPGSTSSPANSNPRYVITGTVHEYRYKTDLDGDPAVGVTLRLLNARTGEVLWQGSGARVGVWFASLSKTSQKTVEDLLARMPADRLFQANP
jgi:hypothetical protein